jgi:hypothetical protein
MAPPPFRVAAVTARDGERNNRHRGPTGTRRFSSGGYECSFARRMACCSGQLSDREYTVVMWPPSR